MLNRNQGPFQQNQTPQQINKKGNTKLLTNFSYEKEDSKVRQQNKNSNYKSQQHLNTPQKANPNNNINNSGYYQDQSALKSLNHSDLHTHSQQNPNQSQYSTNPDQQQHQLYEKQEILENIMKNLVEFDIQDLKEINEIILQKKNKQQNQDLQESYASFKFQGGIIQNNNSKMQTQEFEDLEEIPQITQQKPTQQENKIEKLKQGQMFNTTQDFGQFIKAKDLHLQNFDGQDIIKIKILSTWGSTSIVGITEIQFFDLYGEKIEIDNSNISLNIDNVNKNITDLYKLNNGITQTQNKAQMWTGIMPEPPYCLEIIFKGIKIEDISQIQFWNYNKSVIESTKGVKEIIIEDSNEVQKWNGVIQRGCGNSNDDYSTLIKLQEIKNKPLLNIDGKNDSNLNLKSIPKFIDCVPESSDNQDSNLTLQNTSISSNINKNKNQNVQSKQAEDQNQDYQIQIHKPSLKLDDNTNEQTENVKEIIQFEEKMQNIPNQIYQNESKEKYVQQAKLHKIHPHETHQNTKNQEQDLKDQEIENELQQINEQLQKFDQQHEVHNKSEARFKDKESKFMNKQENLNLEEINKSIKNSNLLNNEPENPIKSQTQLQNLNTLKMFQTNNEGCFQKTNEKQKKLGDEISEMQKLVDNNLQQVHKNLENSHLNIKESSIIDNNDIDQYFIEEIKNPQHKQQQKHSLEQSMKINTKSSFYNSNKIPQGIRKKEPSIVSNTRQSQNSIGTIKSAVIKNLPQGQYLQIKIFSTWGDKYYVGLNGIQFYDQNGDEIIITKPKKQVNADPSDINVLPQYNNDPRLIKNIVNNVYSTRDDLNVWLAPFQKGKSNFIWIDFMQTVKLSMIRIWNYNKSRIHSFRGVKEIQISLQNKIIFQGEIKKSPGHLQEGIEKQLESIFFTDDKKVIEHIKSMVWIQNNNSDQFHDSNNNIMNQSPTKTQNRPLTGHKDLNLGQMDEEQLINQYENMLKNQDDRPFTIVDVKQQLKQEQKEISVQQNQALKESILLNKTLNFKANQKINKNKQITQNTKYGIKCKLLTFEILSNWGDENMLALKQIQVLDSYNKVIANTSQQNVKYKIFINNKKTEAYSNDIIITQNFVQQKSQQQNNTITIQFSQEQIITGVRIWNYSKKQREDTLKGIKNVVIYTESKNYLTDKEGVIIRKAEGNLDIFDPGQLIKLPYQQIQQKYFNQKIQQTLVNQFYEVFDNIIGLNIKINILSNWGDLHYVGLNRIDIFDGEGNSIARNGNLSIAGYPSSVNIISGLKNDHRTIDKLLNANSDEKNVWLTPFISQLELENQQSGNNIQKVQSQNNKILMYLDQPQKISGIKFYNYSKTIQRGVKEIEIIVDDLLIYKGYLNQYKNQDEQLQDSQKEKSTCVLFTLDEQIKNKICGSENYEEQKFDQHVNFYNENKLEKQKI